jgi:hypothetical protein
MFESFFAFFALFCGYSSLILPFLWRRQDKESLGEGFSITLQAAPDEQAAAASLWRALA